MFLRGGTQSSHHQSQLRSGPSRATSLWNFRPTAVHFDGPEGMVVAPGGPQNFGLMHGRRRAAVEVESAPSFNSWAKAMQLLGAQVAGAIQLPVGERTQPEPLGVWHSASASRSAAWLKTGEKRTEGETASRSTGSRPADRRQRRHAQPNSRRRHVSEEFARRQAIAALSSDLPGAQRPRPSFVGHHGARTAQVAVLRSDRRIHHSARAHPV